MAKATCGSPWLKMNCGCNRPSGSFGGPFRSNRRSRRMAIREILQLGNPLLWEQSAPIETFDSEATRTLIRDLDDTLTHFYDTHGFGRAIAAPQIGSLNRAIFVRMQPSGFCGPLINPRIVWADPEQIEVWDDCFSFPDLLVKLRRARQIEVEYQDAQGTVQQVSADEDFSELLQHEIDHLDGILAVQRAQSPKDFSTRKEWERIHRARR
ncbi:peptide deformylase [candidate division KSB3 bacterium]|uniref:Peptide deformylase n=1 Tax=candidate division KSB3 bacterium TaxID=2044937 RepID=A0A9D5JRZ7_9BACT|nr:peptide deformylase [candidate division KSB3 bacterium]MBD3323177.1 peptide deformylase [candidate division KSB3 bacterium]